MTPEEIDQAWSDIRAIRAYDARWRFLCLLWFTIGLVLGASPLLFYVTCLK